VVVPWTYEDLPATAIAKAIANLPGDAIVVIGHIQVDVGTDFGTSCVLDLGDSADPNRYTSSPIDLQTPGNSFITITGYKTLVSEDLIITPTIVTAGVATVGSGRIVLMYVREGRANEVRT
jgi:hypothetical protein